MWNEQTEKEYKDEYRVNSNETETFNIKYINEFDKLLIDRTVRKKAKDTGFSRREARDKLAQELHSKIIKKYKTLIDTYEPQGLPLGEKGWIYTNIHDQYEGMRRYYYFCYMEEGISETEKDEYRALEQKARLDRDDYVEKALSTREQLSDDSREEMIGYTVAYREEYQKQDDDKIYLIEASDKKRKKRTTPPEEARHSSKKNKRTKQNATKKSSKHRLLVDTDVNGDMDSNRPSQSSSRTSEMEFFLDDPKMTQRINTPVASRISAIPPLARIDSEVSNGTLEIADHLMELKGYEFNGSQNEVNLSQQETQPDAAQVAVDIQALRYLNQWKKTLHDVIASKTLVDFPRTIEKTLDAYHHIIFAITSIEERTEQSSSNTISSLNRNRTENISNESSIQSTRSRINEIVLGLNGLIFSNELNREEIESALDASESLSIADQLIKRHLARSSSSAHLVETGLFSHDIGVSSSSSQQNQSQQQSPGNKG